MNINKTPGAPRGNQNAKKHEAPMSTMYVNVPTELKAKLVSMSQKEGKKLTPFIIEKLQKIIADSN